MRRSPRRPFSLPVVFCAVACAMFGANEPAKNPQGGIAGARKDYETITATKTGDEQRRLSVPGAKLPELQLKPDAPAIHLPPESRRAPQEERPTTGGNRKSDNWLVEAMIEQDGENTKADSTEEALNIDGRDEPPRTLLETAIALEKEQRLKEQVKEDAQVEATKTSPVNPLSAYMSSWLDPRDSGPASDASTLTGSRIGGLNDVKIATGSASASEPTRRMIGIDFSDSNGAGGQPRPAASSDANPYLGLESAMLTSLREQNVPPPIAPSLAASMHTPAPVVPAGVPHLAQPADTRPLSEQLKSQDDSRYFKQLKRF